MLSFWLKKSEPAVPTNLSECCGVLIAATVTVVEPMKRHTGDSLRSRADVCSGLDGANGLFGYVPSGSGCRLTKLGVENNDM